MERHIDNSDWEAERAEWIYVPVREDRKLGRLVSMGVMSLVVAGIIAVALILR